MKDKEKMKKKKKRKKRKEGPKGYPPRWSKNLHITRELPRENKNGKKRSESEGTKKRTALQKAEEQALMASESHGAKMAAATTLPLGEVQQTRIATENMLAALEDPSGTSTANIQQMTLAIPSDVLEAFAWPNMSKRCVSKKWGGVFRFFFQMQTKFAMDLAYMCVKPQMRLHVCQALPPPKHQMRLYVCHQMPFICVSPNAFICVSPNASAEFVTELASLAYLCSLRSNVF